MDYEQISREKDLLNERERNGRKNFKVECFLQNLPNEIFYFHTEEKLGYFLADVNYKNVKTVVVTRLF